MQASAGGEREGKGRSRGQGASREGRRSCRRSFCLRRRHRRGPGEVGFQEQCGRERDEEIGEFESSSRREQESDEERSQSDTAHEMSRSAILFVVVEWHGCVEEAATDER